MEIERAKDFGLWDLAPCELVTEISKEYTVSVFSIEVFYPEKGKKSYSETLKSWPFQTRITTTNTTTASRVE